MRKSKLVYAGILMLLIATIGALRLRSAEKSSIATAAVVRKSFMTTISSSGKTIAKRSVDLKFQTSGLLTWVGVNKGDTVKAYQTIATLDRREVFTNLTKVLRDYASERNDFEETKQVTYKGYSLPNTVPNDTVKRILEKNQWDLDKAVLDVELKSLAVQYASLVTPIAGVVTSIDTPIAGVNITPASAVFQIIDPDSILFRANIDEQDVGKIFEGQEAEIFLDAFPDTPKKGKVTTIAMAAETSSGGSTIFPVEILINDLSGSRVGLNGDATIIIKTTPDALVIPVEAVREEDGKSYVYVKTAKEFRKTAVIIEESGETEIHVSSGLSEGDEVMVKGFDQ